MLTELTRREKENGVNPEPEVDFFMKATAIEGDESSLITYYTLRVSITLVLSKSFHTKIKRFVIS